MSTPFVKFIGVVTAVASVVASGRSLYSACNASLNKFNEKGCVHYFDAETRVDPLFQKTNNDYVLQFT
jgi:hypothetical protein